jgi:hypothetical protein
VRRGLLVTSGVLFFLFLLSFAILEYALDERDVKLRPKGSLQRLRPVLGVIIPGYEKREECHDNLRQIDGAITARALEARHYRGDRIPVHEFAPYLKTGALPGALPVCRSGGRYIIGRVGQRPVCSCHGDLLAAEGVNTSVPRRPRAAAQDPPDSLR